MTTISITIYGNNEDEETTLELPAKFMICPHCQGSARSSAYLGAYTQSEMDEAGPEFHDAYMAGAYDRPCPRCEATPGRVIVLDRAKASKEQRALYDREAREEREYQALCAAERWMGA